MITYYPLTPTAFVRACRSEVLEFEKKHGQGQRETNVDLDPDLGLDFDPNLDFDPDLDRP